MRVFSCHGCLDSLNANHHGEDTCMLAEVTLNYSIAVQKRLKRKEWEGQKILEMNLDSCTLRNSADDQRSSVVIFWWSGKEKRK